MVLLYRLEKIRKARGLKGLCLYLKACSIIIIKYISKDPTPLHGALYGPHISLTNSKIPRILPVSLREGVRKRDPVSIRVALTVCGLYRVLPFEASLKTSTITNPSNVNDSKDFRM